MVIAMSLTVSGCKKAEGRLRESIIRITSTPISIPYDKMCKTGIDSLYNEINVPYRLVIFADSQSCVSCALKHMLDWDPFMESLGQKERKVVLQFIFDPPSSSRETFIKDARANYDDFPVYVDTCHAFISQNTQISNTSLLNVFLVDSCDSVLLVGNPRLDPRLQSLFYKTLVGGN